jgi:RNA polymerase sigma-70 factor (ECF subfamily)
MSLEELMAQAQSGDKKAYAQLLQEVIPLVQGFLSSKLSNSEDVNDVTQEVLISIHKASKTYDPSRPFKTWLFAITRYRLNDFLRNVYAKKEKGTDVNLDDEVNKIFDHRGYADSYDNIDYLYKILQELPEKQRKILTLLKIDGYSVRETSIALGMSESAVKVNVHRTIKDIKIKYAKDAF